ncbi:hypothetical protein HZS55_11450 [Halosimplex rubrum]|uniref:Peptidase M10A and M12B matrixin and adamalysin n=1 Tax=Halosimplex rubrum TaxID=869889 RepID=A0A7D5T6Q8_9EURY|nr:hypothetical protein [Halosimplex rubrum]QLH77875.1 hypothetical protein HZS55_11450 [Halosimplex rubrum]
MNRRAFLGGAGVALSLGVAGRRAASPPDPVVVRVWFSESAATHDALAGRVEGYLGAALGEAVGAVEVEFAPSSVPLAHEGGKTSLGFDWPTTVVEGLVGLDEIDPVGDVNLLVTDGDPRRQPAGYARPRIAATTGGAYIARMAPAERTPPVVPYSLPAAATQLLLHEVGHALGATHGHGAARREGDALVASPMVGSYLWASERVRERHLDDASACGGAYPNADDATERRLGLRYTDCAARALR